MPIHHQLLALLVAFIWGTNFVFIEIGLEELPPFLFACLRFLLAAIPLIFILPRPQVSWLSLASYGFFIGFGQFGLLFWVMQDHLSPGLASLIIQVQAMLTIVLALLLLNERIKPLQVIALLVSMIGIGVIALNRDGDASLVGLGVILIAACSWAAGNLVVKRIGKVSIIAFLAWSSLFAVPPLLAMSWYLEGPDLMQYSVANAGLVSWSVLLWQTIGNTLIGYGLWNWLLHRHAAALVTPWALMVPVFGMWASSLMLDEAMPLWKILAAALIISGLLINLRATQASKA
jgi:O-acetylserine/cysteine efflux transporter